MNAGQGLDVLAVATQGIEAQEIFSQIARPPDVARLYERVDARGRGRIFGTRLRDGRRRASRGPGRHRRRESRAVCIGRAIDSCDICDVCGRRCEHCRWSPPGARDGGGHRQSREDASKQSKSTEPHDRRFCLYHGNHHGVDVRRVGYLRTRCNATQSFRRVQFVTREKLPRRARDVARVIPCSGLRAYSGDRQAALAGRR